MHVAKVETPHIANITKKHTIVLLRCAQKSPPLGVDWEVARVLFQKATQTNLLT